MTLKTKLLVDVVTYFKRGDVYALYRKQAELDNLLTSKTITKKYHRVAMDFTVELTDYLIEQENIIPRDYYDTAFREVMYLIYNGYFTHNLHEVACGYQRLKAYAPYIDSEKYKTALEHTQAIIENMTGK